MRTFLLLLVSTSLIACDDGDTAEGTPAPDENPPMSEGEALFMQRHDDGNTFTCNTCHAIDEPAADFRRPGHPIRDAANRPSYKNGSVASLLDAVNSCREEWMVAPAFAPEDSRWQALEGYLQDLAGDAPGEAIEFEIVQPPAELDGGNAMDGQATFNASCAVCHGTDAAGTQQAPPLVGEFLDAETIARRIRTSGLADSAVYDGLTGGRMPFWSADRLSDAELLDLVAFVLANAPGQAPMEDLDDERARDCDATHPKVGQSGTFSTFSHGVAGTATIIDDCTIQLDDFVFDGLGVNVQIYGGLDGDYDGGFTMSEDIRRSGGYDGESLVFQLPPDRTLDDLDGVSVWCVPIGVNFGDARFE